MFDTAAAVAEVEQAIDRLSRGLEPETIPASAAMGLVRTVAHAERQLGGVKMRLAGRVAETPVWKHQGHRSPAHWLAGESRSSVAEAAGVLDTAAKLAELPATLGGLRDGVLSRPQAAAIADAAAVAPGAEADLVALAARESLKGLRDEAARRKTAHLDEQARHAAILASRHVRFGVEPDGAATLSVRATADAVAEIRAGISHFQNQVFDQARRDGLRDRFEAYAVDGLVAMARSALGGGDAAAKRLPTKVVVRVDGTVLDRGHAREGDTCEVTGAGPVPASHVAELLATGEAFAAVVATDPAGRVTRVAHVGRRPVADTSVLVDALAARGRDVTVAHHSPPAGCLPAHGARVDHAHLRGAGLRSTPPRDRPSRGLGPHPPHQTRRARRVLLPSPPAEDQVRLAPRSRNRPPPHAPARRAPAARARPAVTRAARRRGFPAAQVDLVGWRA